MQIDRQGTALSLPPRIKQPRSVSYLNDHVPFIYSPEPKEKFKRTLVPESVSLCLLTPGCGLSRISQPMSYSITLCGRLRPVSKIWVTRSATIDQAAVSLSAYSQAPSATFWSSSPGTKLCVHCSVVLQNSARRFSVFRLRLSNCQLYQSTPKMTVNVEDSPAEAVLARQPSQPCGAGLRSRRCCLER